MRDDAYAPLGLSAHFAKAAQGGHHAVEAFLVEGAEPFVDEEYVDVHIRSVQGRKSQREGQRYHKLFATRKDGGAAHFVAVEAVEYQDGQLLVVGAASQGIAFGDLVQVDVGVVQERKKDMGLYQIAEAFAAEAPVEDVPVVVVFLGLVVDGLLLFQFLVCLFVAF